MPHRTTFSRRYKALYATLQSFIAFIGQEVPDLGDEFANFHLVEDKSLFKAQGPVWHQSDHKAGRIPDKLCHLDTEATWGKSAYQGWVYGYGQYLTCTDDAFPSWSKWKLLPLKKVRLLTIKPKLSCANCVPLR